MCPSLTSVHSLPVKIECVVWDGVSIHCGAFFLHGNIFNILTDTFWLLAVFTGGVTSPGGDTLVACTSLDYGLCIHGCPGLGASFILSLSDNLADTGVLGLC